MGFDLVLTQSPKRYHGTHGRSSTMYARLGSSTPFSAACDNVSEKQRNSLDCAYFATALTLCKLRPMDADKGVERAMHHELRLGATCRLNVYGGANNFALHEYFVTP